MRVALLSYNARAGDAIGDQVAEKLDFFLDRGADVRVFVECDERLHPRLMPHCRRLHPHSPPRADWDYLASADLVVVEYGHTYSLLSLLPLLSERPGRILFDYHGVTPPDLWGETNRGLLIDGQRQRGLVWCADAAVAHSRFTRDELLQATGFPDERTFTLGHPLNSEFSTWRRREQSGVRPARLAGPTSATVLLFVGRLARNKRVPVLVEALAHLRDLSPAVHAVVIGDTSDAYAQEADRCRQLAGELGVADRLHLLGHVDASRLHEAYRSADVFVMPSRHEGFCIPIVEAMAAGLPAVAARAGALPETVANAGLTFTPDDAEDLARQVRRILSRRESPPPLPSPARGEGETIATRSLPPCGGGVGWGRGEGETIATRSLPPCGGGWGWGGHAPLRVAIVAHRYGADFVGGAETSLRTIAEALRAAGHGVEVFTTCARSEDKWVNHYPEGSISVGGITVHRYGVDPGDAERYRDAVQNALRNPDDRRVMQEFLQHSVPSARLLESLGQRLGFFDAIIAGPYGVGLTHAVARAFPEKTLLLPCFHDEPLARLPVWPAIYGEVGGILYHSPEEQELAQTQLGVNHPRAVCCGTVVGMDRAGNAARGKAHLRATQPYLVYCGRYSHEKDVPALLEVARRYARRSPNRFWFVFMGAGNVPIPSEPRVKDLGFVDEQTKRDVLAGAAALVQLSRNESLSLAALEAWCQGVPVLADRRCPVLAGHIQRSGGGKLVEGADELPALLDDLWRDPAAWRERGRQGQDYVRRQYGCRTAFLEKLVRAVRDLSRPLAQCLRQRGRERAAQFERTLWRERFAALVERVLDSPPRSKQPRLQVLPRVESRTVSAGAGAVLVPVLVCNAGAGPAVAVGPGRWQLRAQVFILDGAAEAILSRETPLPELVQPGQTLTTAIAVPVPESLGSYRVVCRAFPAEDAVGAAEEPRTTQEEFALIVAHTDQNAARHSCSPLLDRAQAALARAHPLTLLPTDYNDVTQGWLARWKRWLKRKLLWNFKRAYVDVLSRQQSDFNASALTALHELAECCTVLDRVTGFSRELADSRKKCRELEARLERLEAQLVDAAPGTSPCKAQAG